MPSPLLLVAVGTASSRRHIAFPNGFDKSHESKETRLQNGWIQSSKASLERCTRPAPGLHPNTSTPNCHPSNTHIPQTMHRPPTAPRACNVTPEILNPVVIEDRDTVACAWPLPLSVPLHEDGMLDVLAAFLTATRAIRHVRSYAIALSDWNSHCHRSAPKEEYRSNVAARNAGWRVLPVIPSFER
jgi:hypothetical protein